MSLTVKCDSCGKQEPVDSSPSGFPMLPKGWNRYMKVIKEGHPRTQLHSCSPSCQQDLEEPVTGSYWGDPQ